MLLSFSVQNFRSYKDEQTLNLLASKRLGLSSTSHHCCELPDTNEYALRVASLYGANGAGKSNLVRALQVVQRLILRGTSPRKRIPYQPFVLDVETSSRPSFFELRFLEDTESFRYGFCCDAERIHEEWLSIYEGKKERNLFSRVTSEDGSVTVDLGKATSQKTRSKKMTDLAKVGARPNQLFLTEIVNLDDPEAQGPHFKRAIRWFRSTLEVIAADAPFAMLAEAIATDDKFAEFAGRFLLDANTGIAGLDVQTREMSRSELSSISSTVWEKFLEGVADCEVAIFPGPDGEEMFIDGAKRDVVKIRLISAIHALEKGDRIHLPLHEESDGSKRLLDLLPALYRLRSGGGVFVIDELERSMHPMLARKFIEFFLKAARNKTSQLIFTTHDTTLLDLEILRRDGIWFAEKDQSGATHLYSLADFKVRNDLRIDKGYLHGRFGAIPFLGGIDHLIEREAATKAQA